MVARFRLGGREPADVIRMRRFSRYDPIRFDLLLRPHRTHSSAEGMNPFAINAGPETITIFDPQELDAVSVTPLVLIALHRPHVNRSMASQPSKQLPRANNCRRQDGDGEG
ncbi:hypothetical protein DW352_15300 [Pseudolabrys taiwanensis]|uniref:Uncharacterized protein n=1 Tax=Pseudolabrys taiwanensis TaxID=331696 RepID=A0A345ZXX1_9HYPH|nr:hypothetical protein DW352_15300 [Pseudolabrys taiwanensis]